MMYPYLTLNDDTEITHSELRPDGRVKVYIETPDERDGFHNATCYLPDYTWESIHGYSDQEMAYFKRLIRDNAHLIMEFAQEGGKSLELVPTSYTSGQMRECLWSPFTFISLKEEPPQMPQRFGSQAPATRFSAITTLKFLQRSFAEF